MNAQRRHDCSETPDPRLLKQYRSMVAKIQFAAHWIRFDISYAAAQLARFCASAGPLHWAALTHLVGYLVHRPSFKLTYRKDSAGGLDGYTVMARYNRGPVLLRSKMQ